MKKIISFCLWGDDTKYTIGAIRNAELAEEYYPDWICRFYVGKSVPSEIIETLAKKKNTEIITMEQEGDWTGMFWRFYPASEPDVDVMISRDTDSRLGSREKLAVDEWLKGDKDFHIMRDHPHHGTEILGGMWGVRNGVIPNMKQMISDYVKGNFWQVDQNFLRDMVYPVIINNACVHDEFFEKKSFPKSNRDAKHFVGQVYDKDDNPVF
jgi:hypothetical protein